VRAVLLADGGCEGDLMTDRYSSNVEAAAHHALRRRPNTMIALPESLDAGIRAYVETLAAEGVETFESCEGGEGHSMPEPTVKFYGEQGAGFHALAVALEHGLPVLDLRRSWMIIAGEPTGPYWELTFRQKCLQR
jgi:hypothetical protein